MKPGIYVHLPFCKVHCSYCDFPLTTRRSLMQEYHKALLAEIAMHPPHESADTLYFGGGTPSLVPPEALKQIKEQFLLDHDSEITLEANPDDMDATTLHAWMQLGINRLSIGIQSLEETALRLMLRQHTAQQALKTLPQARSSGFRNINVDLIIGSPAQTVNGFLKGLSELIEFHPEHFSVYLIEIHENTALYKQIEKGKVIVMSEEEQLKCFSTGVELLEHAGYEHYEVSNFALPGNVSRHNLKYWSNVPYYAYGAGACSYVDSTRTQNIASVTGYIEAVQGGRLPAESMIREDTDTQMRNAVIFGLRKREGIDLAEFEQRFGVSALSLFPQNASDFLQQGFLEVAGSRLRLTFSGMLLSNEILSTLV